MSGGTTEVHKDTDYLISGTHRGGNSASTLVDRKAYFVTANAKVGLAIENYTKGYRGVIYSITEHEIVVSWATNGLGTPITFGSGTLWFGSEQVHFEEGIGVWDYGDTYRIYKTTARGTIISTQWTDLSRGWKTPQDELIDGWREEDIDLNPNGEREVWGPGQPENYRK